MQRETPAHKVPMPNRKNYKINKFKGPGTRSRSEIFIQISRHQPDRKSTRRVEGLAVLLILNERFS